MIRLFLDFETYFEGSTKYSLRNQKISMTEYVRHEKFQVQGFSYWFEGSEELPQFIRGPDALLWLSRLEWSNIELVAHNAHFEAIVLREHYGIVPARYFCTMASSEALLQGMCNAALDDLAKRFHLGEKLPDLERFKNLRMEDFTEEDWEILARYANNDVELTIALFNELGDTLPQFERDLMSMTIRLFGDPVLSIDLELAKEARDEAIQHRMEILEKTGLPEKEISGDISFTDHLKAALGEATPIPTKWSQKQKKDVPAFAKTDLEFLKLRHHESATVRNLVEARLVVKSTQPITRAKRFITTATTGTQLLAVCLHYGRAHTLRWTAGDSRNVQNMKRGSKLRRAIKAPPGYVIVVVDSAQIEARMLAWLVGDEDLLAAFRDPDRDPYAEQAEIIFGRPINKKDDPVERFVGKVCVLGLGYGMGVKKLLLALLTGSMGGEPMDVEWEFAQNAVRKYRKSRPKIEEFWDIAENMFKELIEPGMGGNVTESNDGLLKVNRTESRIDMPNMYLRYNTPKMGDEGSLTYTVKKGKNWVTKYVWGGVITENIVQKLARDVVAYQISLVAERYRPVLTVHDELAYLAKEEDAEEALQFGLECFRTAPDWCQDLPLDAEGGYDYCYSK